MLNIGANRRAKKWSSREQIGRLLWAIIYPLFKLSPRPLWGWRRWLLRCFGARVGPEVHIHPSVRVTIPWNLTIGAMAGIGDHVQLYALGPITIGKAATISQGAHLCAGTHNYKAPDLPLIKAPIVIGDEAWICADAYVGPGVTIGKYSILGARGVAIKDIPTDKIAAGNPARIIKSRNFLSD